MKKGVILITWPETRGTESKTILQPHLHKLPWTSHQNANSWKSEVKTGSSCWGATHPQSIPSPPHKTSSMDFFLPLLPPAAAAPLMGQTSLTFESLFQQVKKVTRPLTVTPSWAQEQVKSVLTLAHEDITLCFYRSFLQSEKAGRQTFS